MHSAAMNSGMKGRSNIPDVKPRIGSTKLAAVAIRDAFILAALVALLLMAAQPAQGQTETVLHNFMLSDGAQPDSSLTSDGDGNFYGTTTVGGLGGGTVFELSPNGSGGWNETTLYSFCSAGYPFWCADGQVPKFSGVIFDCLGNLYGTTQSGGSTALHEFAGCGVVFELTPLGTGWTETVLHNFMGGADGCFPMNPLIMDRAGNLYGTTADSPHAAGTVFELSPSGGGWAKRVIYTLGSRWDNLIIGGAGLAMDAAGNIFGAGSGEIFELSPNGNGGWSSTVIHKLGEAEGVPVLDQAGNLYGTTTRGGSKNQGTVYELSPGKTGGWAKKILYAFEGGNDGSNPQAGIAFDVSGNIYGTTTAGGEYGAGTVFELVAPVGSGSYQEKVLWSFNGGNGDFPQASLVLDSVGNLYSTTLQGGSSNAGVVFEVSGVPAATATTLTSSPNPSTYGQSVNFTAVVTSSAGAPPDGETVTFELGTTVLGTGALNAGLASLTTSALPLGMDLVKAAYGGDSNFAGSTSNTVKQRVKKAKE